MYKSNIAKKNIGQIFGFVILHVYTLHVCIYVYMHVCMYMHCVHMQKF